MQVLDQLVNLSSSLLYLLGLALGLCLGLLAGLLVGSRRGRKIGEESAGLAARLGEKEARIGALEKELQVGADTRGELQRQMTELCEERARLEAALDNERRSAAEKLAHVEKAEEKLREAFQALSAEALRQNSRSFLDLAKASLDGFQRDARSDLEARQRTIGEIVKPIEERLKVVDVQLREIEKERAGAYSALREQVGSMAAAQQQLQAETANLVKALRAPNVRGRWGEIQLRRVVEMAGMLDHCDFFEQQSTPTDDGRLQPDLLVRLPGGKNVVVDAKTPLAAYLDALEAPDEAARAARLADHARQVREHVAQLAGKRYWSQFPSAPEFVVMFLPGESFFSAALQEDPALIEHSVNEKVIPASPTTLISLLRAVSYGWRQERLAENAQAVANLGRQLYDGIRTLADHFARLGKKLEGAVEDYNAAVGSLERSVLARARRLQELGVPASKGLPDLKNVDVAARLAQAAELVDESGGTDDREGGGESGSPSVERPR